jgi:hypothetical protein
MKQPTNNKDESGIMKDELPENKGGIDTEGIDKVGTLVL